MLHEQKYVTGSRSMLQGEREVCYMSRSMLQGEREVCYGGRSMLHGAEVCY